MPCAAYVVWVYFEAIVMIQRFNSVRPREDLLG
jgi:hypothetical protein